MRPGPTARAAAVFAVFLAVFIAVDQLSRVRPHHATAVTAAGAAAASIPPPSTATAVVPSTTTTLAPAPVTTTTVVPPSTDPSPAPSTSTLPPVAGVTVQVLNGVFVPGLAHQVADKLRAAGYDVVAASTAFGHYTVSRVYYTSGHKADALALQARFPAFKVIAPAPASLSQDVALHAVIGENYKDI